jgi:hypothetical protein
MEPTLEKKRSEIMEMLGMSKKITQKEVEDFLSQSKYFYLIFRKYKS